MLTTGGLTLAVVSREPDLRLTAAGASARFLSGSEGPDATLEVRWLEEAGPSDGGDAALEPVFDAGGLWRLLRGGNRLVYELRSPLWGSKPYKVASVDLAYRSGEIRLRRDCVRGAAAVGVLDYPLDELLVQGLLARGRGVEVHACGVVDDRGRGLLFVGPSGAGKTTLARLWHVEPGARVASDDRIILRRSGGRLELHGTPWHGEAAFALPLSAPLAGVFFLCQSEGNALRPLSPAEAATRLLACGFPPFWDRDGLEFTLSFLADVVGDVPCLELLFRPDRGALDLARSGAA
jgi:hypothetical protein